MNKLHEILAVDVTTGAPKLQYQTKCPRWVNFLGTAPFAVSGDDSRFIVGTCAYELEGTCQNGYAEVFDIASGNQVGVVSMGGDEVSGVALSADAGTGYVTHFYQFVCVGCDRKSAGSPVPSDSITEFSVPQMSIVKSLAISPSPNKLVLSPDGAIAYTDGSALTAISLPDLTLLKQVSVSATTQEIAISGNGAILPTQASFYFSPQFNDSVTFYNSGDLSSIGTVILPASSTEGHLELDFAGDYAYTVVPRTLAHPTADSPCCSAMEMVHSGRRARFPATDSMVSMPPT